MGYAKNAAAFFIYNEDMCSDFTREVRITCKANITFRVSGTHRSKKRPLSLDKSRFFDGTW